MLESGSSTRILHGYLMRSIAHILSSYRTDGDSTDDRNTKGFEKANTEDPFELAAKRIHQIQSRPVASRPLLQGYDEIENGVIEALTSFVIHYIGILIKKARSLASHRNRTLNVMDIISALQSIDPDSTAKLGSARRHPTDGTRMLYLSHLKARPCTTMEIDPRMEIYCSRVLRKPSPFRVRPTCPFPGTPTPQLEGPSTTYGTLVKDCARRFYFALCLDVIRAIIGLSAVHARKCSGTEGEDPDTMAEEDLFEWGLDQEAQTKPEQVAQLHVDPDTMRSIMEAICGSEESMQNLISHEVCGIQPHNRLHPPSMEKLVDPVNHFTHQLEFLSPYMAAMIRSLCYRTLLQAWPLITNTIHEALHASRLGLGIVPNPIQRLSVAKNDRLVPHPSHVSFVPFAIKAGLKEYIEQPEPGGSILGALATAAIGNPGGTAIRGSLMQAVMPRSKSDKPPGLETYQLGDTVAYGPAHCPIYAPPIPDISTFGQRLLVQGCPSSVSHLIESWNNYAEEASGDMFSGEGDGNR